MVAPLILLSSVMGGRSSQEASPDSAHQHFNQLGNAESGRPLSRGSHCRSLPDAPLHPVTSRHSSAALSNKLGSSGQRTATVVERERDFAPQPIGSGSLDEREEDLQTGGGQDAEEIVDDDDDSASEMSVEDEEELHNGELAASPSQSAVNVNGITLEDGTSSDRARRRRKPRGFTFERFNTMTSVSTWSSWIDPATESGPIRRVFKKIKDFIWPPEPEDAFLYIPNYRWLPIYSGVFSPLAILLEIPGLTEHWYIKTENNKTIDYKPNPAILDVALAISMGSAVFANFALIARFLEKRIKFNTWLCVILLVIHDIINVVTCTTFGVIHRFNDGFTYGEAFWMCIASTIFSITVCGTLLFDLWQTPNFDRSGSGLTRKQRSLVILVMVLLCYIALGSLVFSVLMNLTFQDGLYFTVVSIETIGFGDFFPTDTASTAFCVIYVTVGIICVGLVVNTTRETVIEAFENAYRKRADEVSKRRQENKIQRAEARAKRVAIEQQLREAGLPLYVREETHHKPATGGGRGGYGMHSVHSKLVLNEKGLEEWRKQQAGKDAAEMTAGMKEEGPTAQLDEPNLTSDQMKARTLAAAAELKAEAMLSNVEGEQDQTETYQQFRNRIKKEEQKEFVAKLVVAWALFWTFWLIGTGLFVATERWGFGRSLYFCWMAFSTIGYGEITPVTPAGRAVFVVWALMGVAAMTILIAVISEAYASRYKSALQNSKFRKAITAFRGKEDEANHTEHPSPVASVLHLDHEGQQSIQTMSDLPPSVIAQKVLNSTHNQLDPIPVDVIRHAKSFRDHVRYFSDTATSAGNHAPPAGVMQLLDEIAAAERLDERMKQEMLGDQDSRRALFFISYERAFKNLIETAEKAVEIISLKDSEWEYLIGVLKEREEKQRGRDRDSRRSATGTASFARSSKRGPQPSPATVSFQRHDVSKKRSINSNLLAVPTDEGASRPQSRPSSRPASHRRQ